MLLFLYNLYFIVGYVEMPRETISEFPLGIGASPGHGGGSFKSAADMLNIEIDKIGRPVSRLGYIHDNSDVYGTGNKIAKIHFIGNQFRSAQSRIFRFQDNESWVADNGRIIISGSGVENRWIDIDNNNVYDWSNEPPAVAPLKTSEGRTDGIGLPRNLFDVAQGIIGLDDITNGILAWVDQERINSTDPQRFAIIGSYDRYAICYTYYSNKFGIESPPSFCRMFDIAYDGSTEANSDFAAARVEFDFADAPAWANAVRVYITSEPVGTRNGYSQFDDDFPDVLPPRYSYNNPVDTEKVFDSGFEFQLVNTRGRDGTTTDSEHSNGFDRFWYISFRLGWGVIGTAEENDELKFTQSFIDSVSLNGPLSNHISGDPPENLSHILLYAGRIWGWDKDTNSVRFSLIDGRGVSNYDIFPYDDTALPHAISFTGPWQGEVTHLSVMPGKGGIYVFFRDAIRTIVGRALIKGLYSPDVSPQTDLDASGGIEGFGTLSPKSVIAFRSVTMFLGSDKTLYQISGESDPTDMGLAIQPWLDEIDDDELEDVDAFGFDDKYHLILESGVFVLDIKRKYWTRFDWPIVDAFWSTGGSENESILYGLIPNDDATYTT